MALLDVRTGPPPQAPQSVSHDCQQDQRIYLCITIRNGHAQNTPVMGTTRLRMQVGDDSRTLETDENGLVTFVYQQEADLQNRLVRATLTDTTRGWEGSRLTTGATKQGNVYQVSVTVEGYFTISVQVATRKPGTTGLVYWPLDWTPTLQLRHQATPSGGVAAVDNIAFQRTGIDNPAVTVTSERQLCVTSHQFSVALQGFQQSGTQVRLWIETEDDARQVSTDPETYSGVTYRSTPGNGLQLEVQRHRARVRALFIFAFPQVLVVGEGTNFEYAVGLATKYGDALNARGFKWVVATQYDVVAVGNVPTDMVIGDWATGNSINHANQRQTVQNAMAKNLIIRTTQFDARNGTHWQQVLDTYSLFDAVVFNNPHPGYGMHMCEVMGLTTHDSFRYKNGKCISVYSVGYNGTLDGTQLDDLLGRPRDWDTAETFGRQRWFVRSADALNHQNNPDTAFIFQHSPNNSRPVNVTIDGGFAYNDGQRIDRNWYGKMGEFQDQHKRHYRSRIDTIGLQEHLLRCYRHFSRSLLKSGGELFVNGSTQWADSLTTQFTFNDGANNHNVPVMQNAGDWPNTPYFVWYNTNLTSNRAHPSWYSNIRFVPREPALDNAQRYRWQNP